MRHDSCPRVRPRRQALSVQGLPQLSHVLSRRAFRHTARITGTDTFRDDAYRSTYPATLIDTSSVDYETKYSLGSVPAGVFETHLRAPWRTKVGPLQRTPPETDVIQVGALEVRVVQLTVQESNLGESCVSK